MITEKRENLKHFSDTSLYSNLINVRSLIPDDYLDEKLNTKKSISDKIGKIVSCSEKNYSVLEYDKDSNGEITKYKNNVLYDSSCGVYLVCPICARKRKEQIQARYREKITELSKSYDYVYMVTYTVQDTETFSKGYNILNSGLRKFRRMGQKRKDGSLSPGEAGKINAAIDCTEVKIGKNSGKWHVHVHQIAFCDKPLDYRIYDENKKKEIIAYYNDNFYCDPDKDDLLDAAIMTYTREGKKIPLSKLSMEWFFCTGRTSTNIDVIPLKVDGEYRSIKRRGKRINLNDSNIGIALNEIVKYATKVNDLDSERLFELLRERDNKRFLNTWGELRNINDGEPGEIEELLLPDHIIDAYSYDFEKGKYRYGDEKDQKYANDLYLRLERLKEYRNKLLESYRYKSGLLNTIKTGLILTPINKLRSEERESIINDVNSIHTAYRYYTRLLFCKIVSIPGFKTDKKNIRRLNKKEKYYFKLFVSLNLF